MAYAEVLIDFLLERDESAARDLLARSGGILGQKHGADPEPATIEVAQENTRAKILLELGVRTLEPVIQSFRQTLDDVKSKLQTGQKYKLWSSLITTILSSGVVASLGLAKDSALGMGLGVLALGASILTLLAGRLEGGEGKLAEEYTSISGLFTEATALLERLRAYSLAPELFTDIDAQLERAAALVKHLAEWRAKHP